MKKNLLLVTSLILGGLSSAGSSETLNEALGMAYTTNPQLQAERAGLRAIDEQLNQAKAARLPGLQLDANVGATRLKQSSPFFSSTQTYYPNSLGVSGSQTLYGGGAIRGQIDLARINVLISRNNLAQIEQQVLLDTLTAFVDVRRNSEVVRIRTNNVQVLMKQLDAAKDRFEVGEITRTGVSQAKARVAGARSQLAAAKSALAVSRAAYERNVGQAPGTLTPATLPEIMPSDLASAIIWSEDHAPVMVNAKLSELSAQHAIRVARAGLRPTLSLGAQARTANNAGFSGATQDSVSTSLNFSMPLFTGGLNQSRVRQALQQASQARIGILQARRVTQEQVSNAWHQLMAAHAVIRASEEQVEANQLAFEGVVLEAELGSRTTLDVLDAEQELLDARLTLVSANRDSLVAAYSLLAATGQLNVMDLQVDVVRYDTRDAVANRRASLFSTRIE